MSCSSNHGCATCGRNTSSCGCDTSCNSCGSCGSCGCSSCPWPEWMHPILCNPTHFCRAGCENGATLVIHKIVLEPCGNQSCTPKNFSIRITGPSYPNGEIFTLRAGSCIELDEPLVISGLTPGQYQIEEIFATPNEYITTITGPVCGRCVMLAASCTPTVVTLVNRKRLCRLCHGFGCGCAACSACCH